MIKVIPSTNILVYLKNSANLINCLWKNPVIFLFMPVYPAVGNQVRMFV